MTEIQRYEMIALTRCGEAWQELQEEPEGDWMRYADHAAALAEKDAEIQRLKKLAEASERWRLAYQEGKEKLYAMGGEIAEAALAHLPCNEGGIDLLSRRVFLYPQLDAAQQKIATLKEENERLKAPVSDEEWGAHCEDYLVPQSVRNDLPEHDNEGGSVHEEALSRKSFDTLIAAHSGQ